MRSKRQKRIKICKKKNRPKKTQRQRKKKKKKKKKKKNTHKIGHNVRPLSNIT